MPKPTRGHYPLSFLIVWVALILGLAGTFFLWYWPGPPPRSGDETFETDFVVIQLNDIYRIDSVQDGKVGGLGRIATLVKELQQQNKRVLIVHAGDFLEPSLESSRFHGQQMVAALNYLNGLAPLVVVPGNHEFDQETPKLLVDAINNSKFTWIGANFALQKDSATDADPHAARSFDAAKAKIDSDKEHELMIFGGMKVGFVALTLDNAHGSGSDRVYAPIDGNYESIAVKKITDLEQRGAEVIIGLTHLDMTDDVKLAKLRRLHPRFMWIAGGHEHYWQREKLTESSALITKGDSNARSVWKVSVGHRNGNPAIEEERIEVDDRISVDAAYHRDIEEYYHAQLKKEIPQLDVTLAQVNQLLKNGNCLAATEEDVRNMESNWGSFIADQMRAALPGNKPADIAIINGGSIRIDDVLCNQVRLEELERTFPYGTNVIFVKLTGADIRDKILRPVVSSKFGDGSFLQVSGLQFKFDRQTNTLDRNIKVQTNKGLVDLNDKTSYTVATPEYLLNCGDGYRFRESITELLPVLGPDVRLLVYDALARSGQQAGAGTKQSIPRILELPAYLLNASVKNRKIPWKKATGNLLDCNKKIRFLFPS
jgi:5'-nucleotidase / UDP-sugar diphosphatase